MANQDTMSIEAAQALFRYGPGLGSSVTRETVLEWIRRGWVEARHDTGEVLLDAASVQRLLEQRWNPATGRLKPTGVRGMVKESRKVRITAMVADQPGISYADIARELGVDWRTVRTYMDEMRGAGVLAFDPETGEWSVADP